MHEKNELDLLIDSAIATYGGAEEGLEDRILARAAEMQDTRRLVRRRLWMLAIAVPVAACLLLLILVPHWRVESPPKENAGPYSTTARNVQPAPAPLAGTTRQESQHGAKQSPIRIAPAAARQKVMGHPSLPKLDVFPTPQPLSPEEQALLAFATQAPDKDRRAVVDAQQSQDAPLAIASIKIPPIAPPEEGKN